GKAQGRRAAQRCDRKFLPLIPAGSVRQPFLAGKRSRGFGEGPLLVRWFEIHTREIRGGKELSATGDQAGAETATGSSYPVLPVEMLEPLELHHHSLAWRDQRAATALTFRAS